jgi:hypothetical protein
MAGPGALAALSGVGAALQAGSSLYGIIQGIVDRRRGRRMYEEAMANRPTYEMAPEIRQRLGLRQSLLTSQPAQFRDLENDIFANQAGTIYNARQAAPGSAALLGTLGASQADTNRALRAAAMQESEDYQRRLAGLESAQGAMAGERMKAFELNELAPFEEQRSLGLEMMNVGGENIYGGLRTMSGTLGQLAEGESENKLVSTLFGQLFQGRRKAPSLRGLYSPFYDNPSNM